MKHLILISTAISAGIAPFVLAQMEIDISKSLSAHIAKSKWAIWFARIAILSVCVIIALWYFGWYVPAYSPSGVLTGLVIMFCALAAVVAIFPRYKGKRVQVIHDAAAYAYSFVIPFVIMLMGLNAHSDIAMVVLVALSYILWAILAAGVYRPAWRYFLYFQLSFLALFGTGLLVATYVG